MAKITYLIGAGASFGTVPLIDKFPEGIQAIHFDITQSRSYIESNAPIDQSAFYINAIDNLLKDCLEFKLGAEKHKSVDKYARFLYLTKEFEKFKRLKVIISFVVIHSTYVNPINERYDTFFQEIFGDSVTDFNNDYRIISWNYDFLFEKAYSVYSGSKSLRANQMALHVNNYGIAGNQGTGSFRLYKINGTTSFYYPDGSREVDIHDDLDLIESQQILLNFVTMYGRSAGGSEEYSCQLEFAFENNFLKKEEHLINKVINEIQGSRLIVLIGYSIPTVNSEVDKKIFEAVFANATVVLQSKESKQNLIAKWRELDPRYYDAMFTEQDPFKFYVTKKLF
jgi:hypothetical protein